MTDRTPFYVGYLALPPGLRGALIVIVLVLLAADAALVLAWLAAQPAPPSGAWGTVGEVEFQGRFVRAPYPLLRIAAPGRARIVLLVLEGKHGLDRDSLPPSGSLVTATGYPIERGDLTVLQLDRPLAAGGGPVETTSAPAPVPARLSGEIVDAKCWAGAMNPGAGKAHKGCGTFCLLGDIPALFIARTPAGDGRWYLLADAGGGPVGPEARRLVGESVELTGRVAAADGYAVFTADRALDGAP